MALTFEALRAANTARLPTFRNAKGEISHPNIDGHNSGWSLTDWATALAGEVGEACNIIKKIRREDFTLEEAKVELANELADVQIYLDLLAKQAGIDLARATIDKFNATSLKIKSDVCIVENGSTHIPDDAYYILVKSSAVFVKDGAYFVAQGGLTKPWGESWERVRAESIDAARKIGEQLRRARFPNLHYT